MSKEYEVISNTQFRFLNSFLVKINSRALHLHDEIELGVVLEGEITLKTPPTSYILSQGDCFLIDSMDAHEFISNSSTILSIQICPTIFNAFFKDPPSLNFCTTPQLKNFFQKKEYDFLVFLCIELSQSYIKYPYIENQHFKCLSIISQILFLLEKNLYSQSKKQVEHPTMKQQKNKLRSVINFIDQNYSTKILLKDIAKQENLSMSYLSHLFKNSFGISFEEYLNNKRFEEALTLLSTTNRTILDICISTGFSDLKYLNKICQKRLGCSPKAYRKNYLLPENRIDKVSFSTEYRLSKDESLTIINSFKKKLLEKIQDISYFDSIM